jgi:hypothetical protein
MGENSKIEWCTHSLNWFLRAHSKWMEAMS